MSTTIAQKRFTLILGLALMCLFFLEAFRIFAQTIFEESILQAHLAISISALIGLLVLPWILFFRRIDTHLLLFASGALMIIHHLYGTLAWDPLSRLIAYGLVIISFSVFLPCFLTRYLKSNKEKKQNRDFSSLLAAPIGALLVDLLMNTGSTRLDLNQLGLVNGFGEVLISNFWIALPFSLVALYTLIITYEVFVQEREGHQWEKPITSRQVALIFPGILLGTAIATLLFLTGSSQTLHISSALTFSSQIFLTSVELLILLWLVLNPALYKPFFSDKNYWVSVAILNGFLAMVLWDIFMWQTGLASYFLGFAFWGVLFNISLIFLDVAKKEFDLYQLMSITFIGNLTLLVLFLFLIFAKYSPILSPYLTYLQNGIEPLLFYTSQLFVLAGIVYAAKRYALVAEEAKA